MTDKTKILSDFADAFQASDWRVQLKNRSTAQAISVTYSHEQLLSAEKFFSYKNREGFDIYARPLGWQYVLLDDLTRDTLDDLAQYQPCAIVETSPNNYQAWLILPTIPGSRDEAKAICRDLARRFGADPASADPDHVGRLPGYTNKKAQYQNEIGQYPFVRLRRVAFRLATFYPFGAAVLKENQPVKLRAANSHQGNSEKDFGMACGLIRKGLTDEQIYAYLLQHSPGLEVRKGARHVRSYLELTLRNAHRVTGQ